MQIIQCPHCSMQVTNDGSLAGRVVSCPGCRGQFQMPNSPQSKSVKSAFEGIEGGSDDPPPRCRREPSHVGLWVVTLVSLFGIACIAFTGLWMSGIIQFKAPHKVREADQQAIKSVVAHAKAKSQNEKNRPETLKEKPVGIQTDDKDKKEKVLANAGRKMAEVEARKKADDSAFRQGQIDLLLADLDQQARKDIAEIDQRLTSYRNLVTRWEQRVAALKQDPRYGDPFNPVVNAQMNALNQESQALQGDLKSISRLIERKQQAFNQQRDAILQQFPEARPLGWANYFGESR